MYAYCQCTGWSPWESGYIPIGTSTMYCLLTLSTADFKFRMRDVPRKATKIRIKRDNRSIVPNVESVAI